MIMVLIPDLKVYSQISATVITTVNQNGTPKASKTNNCKTLATKKSLKEEPIIRESKKNEAPVL